MKKLSLAAFALVSVSLSGAASAFTVDGSLSDWGVTGSSWVPNAGIFYTVEDQKGAGEFYLSPGWGGQAYDAEAIYAAIVGDDLYIALATGHAPDTKNDPAHNSYGAGDFAIDFGKNGSYELGINVVHNGTGANADPFSIAGGVYGSAQWNYGLWNTAGAYQPGNPDLTRPTSLRGGSYLGMAELAISGGKTGYGVRQTDTHYFYEMSIDLELLQAAGWNHEAFNIHWTENCANDSIMVDPPAYVPEPGSLALLGIGLLGLAGMRRYRS